MRVLIAVLMLSLSAVSSNARHQQERLLSELGFSATPENIAKVIAGMRCAEPRGDTLVFGTTDASRIFEHDGHVTATYRLGYASLLVERGGKSHTHVVTVDPTASVLYYNGARYLCKRPTK